MFGRIGKGSKKKRIKEKENLKIFLESVINESVN